MITICRKAFFYEQLKLGKISFFEVPLYVTTKSFDPPAKLHSSEIPLNLQLIQLLE